MSNANERIKYLRKEVLHLTQQEFSEALNISRSNMGNIETGQISLTERVISDICAKYNVNETWLRTGEGEMFKPKPPEDEVGYYVEELLENDDNPLYRVIIEMMKTYHGLDDKSKEVIKNYFSEIENAIKNKKET